MLSAFLWLTCSAEVSGQLRRAGTREPLAHVAVSIVTMREVLNAETDDAGFFAFTNLAAGEAEINAVDPEYMRESVALSLADGKKTKVLVYLRKKTSNAFETTVLARRDRPQISQVTLTRPEIARSPGAFGDPLRAVQNLPGVARAPLFLGSLNMRGTLGRDSAVMIEGTPLPMLYHLSIGPSVVPDMLIEDITFSPGAFAANYGRSTAGVVDLRLREPSATALRGRVSVDFLMTAGFVEFALGKRTWLSLGFRRSYLDALVAPVILALKLPAVPLPQFTDYQARLVHDFGNARLDVLYFGSFDNFTFIGPKSEYGALKPQWSFQALHPSFLSKGQKWSNRLSALGVYVDNHFHTDIPAQAEVGDVPPLRSSTQQWQFFLRDDLRATLGDGLRLHVGCDLGSVSDRVRSNIPPVVPSSEDPLSDLVQIYASLQRPAQRAQWVGSFGLFATLDFTLGPVRVTPGLRAEVFTFSERSFAAMQPRLQLSFDVQPRVRLMLATGYYQKPPAPETFALMTISDRRHLLSSWQTSGGLEWQATPAISVSATGYFNYLWNDVTVDRMGDSLTRSDGRIYGGELFVRHRPYKNLFASLSYSLMRSERREERAWVLAAVDQTHNLNVVASYILPGGLQLGARFRIASGPPYTSAVDGVWTNQEYTPIGSPHRRNARLPPHHQLDVRLDRTWVFDLWQLTLYLDVMNVYCSPLIVNAGYSYDQRTLVPRTALFPLLPLLGVQGSF